MTTLKMTLGFMVFFVIAISIAIFNWRSKAATEIAGELYSYIQSDRSHFEMDFLIVGDFGSGNKNQWLVAKALEEACKKKRPDGLVLLGDNVYMAGVRSIDDPLWQEVIEKPLSSPCLSHLPIYPVLGNHDYKGNANAQIAYTNHSTRWHLPHRFYAVNFSNLVELISIDTNVADFCMDERSCTVDFMQDRLKESRAITRIILGHHHLTSASEKYRNSFQGWALKPIICQADAYLSGHAHHFEHRQDPDCNADLFVIGTGGADLSQTIDDDSSLHKESNFGFMRLTANRDKVHFRFIQSNGKQSYEYIRRLTNSNRYITSKTMQ